MPQTNFTNDLIAHQTFERLARVLKDRKEDIMRRWEAIARVVLPNGNRLALDQLRNSLPEIMDQIVRALESDDPDVTSRLIDMTKPHGSARFQQEFQIKELVAEYRMWRRILIEEVWRGVDGSLTEQEVTALNMAVDIALEGGILAFFENQRDQIRAATDAEARYLSFMSHDVRNHLNHAALILQVHTRELQKVGGFEEAAKDLIEVQNSIFQTMRAMERLLHAERLSKGAVQPKGDQVDLRQIALVVVAQFAREAAEKKLNLDVRLPDNVILHSDSDLISLALQNLVGNAVKFSNEGGAVIIDGHPTPKPGEYALSVSDDGPGIAPERMETLFKSFTRGDTHGQPGVGLGLTIVDAAVKVLGGTMTVHSQLGQGSTFEMTLADRRA